MANPNPLRELRISHPQLAFLREMARRGGEIGWRWENARPDATAMMADLINKQIVREVVYLTDARQIDGQHAVRLTDVGRAIVDQAETSIGRAKKIETASEPLPVAADPEILS